MKKVTFLQVFKKLTLMFLELRKVELKLLWKQGKVESIVLLRKEETLNIIIV